MIRAMTAFCAVATAFAWFPPEARAQGSARAKAASAAHAGAKPSTSRAEKTPATHGVRKIRVRDEQPDHGLHGERSGREGRSTRGAAPHSAHEEKGSKKADSDDAVVLFDEPGDAPRVSG